jgi:hypothetical protein
MLSQVRITNFKSVRDLVFSPKRVNVFIGEPNTGKSNLVEALAVFSEGIYDDPDVFRDALRFRTVSDLFFDRDLSEVVRVVADGLEWSLKFESSQFSLGYRLSGTNPVSMSVSHDGQLQITQHPEPRTRYYRFKTLPNFYDSRPGTLRAPYGQNLVALLTTNKRLRQLVGDLFRDRGFRLVIDTEKGELIMAKDVNDQLYNFSYPTISETLRRIVFFMAVLETNRDAVLLLDEPEANTFPFYTTYLAERIALDETNQFFLTTHNPYVLDSIVAKTPVEDLCVFVTTMEAYQTKLKPLSREGLSKILEYGPDAFLNLERLTGE